MALAIPLIILLAALVSMGMGVLQRPVSGGLIKWAENLLGNIPLFAGIFTLDQVIKLDRWVTHQLGRAFKAVEGDSVKWFADLAHYVYVTGYWSLYWPIALVHEVKHLTGHTIPRAITARTKPLDHRIDIVEATAKAAAGAAHANTLVIRKGGTVKEITRIERVAMPHAQEWDWIHKHWKALTAAVIGAAALPGTIALDHPLSLPVPFGRTVKQIRRRFGRVEALLGVTAFAATLAYVLRIPSPECLTRGPIGKVARRLCGLSSNALNDLLGLLVDVVIVADICQVIEMLNEGLSIIEGPLQGFVSVAGGALCHGDFAPPPALDVAPLSLPPVTGIRLSLAA